MPGPASGRALRLPERAAPASPAPPETPPDLSAPAGLPDGLRRELLDALVALDTARIAALIGRVAERDAALGQALRRHAETSITCHRVGVAARR